MSLPELGVGIVYVPGLEPLLESGSGYVDVIEIEPQTLWHFRPGSPQPYAFPEDTLSHLRALPQPKIVHSVGFGVGGTQKPPRAVETALADAVSALDAPWISEHLSFTHFGHADETVHTGFMLPPLQTAEGAAVAGQTIREFADRLPVPFAVEPTVNYLRMRDGELTDGAFVAQTVEQADCGILLDLHNLWTNERNGRQTVAEFLAEIPLERVWEIHLAGGFEFEGYWLDAHSGAIPEPVLGWAEALVPALPNLRAVIYEIFPSFVPRFGLDAIERQLAGIASIWARRRAGAVTQPAPRAGAAPASVAATAQPREETPGRWERSLGGLVVFGHAGGRLAQDLSDDPAIGLIRRLIWRFRAGAILKSLGLLVRLISLHSGEKRLERLLDAYFDATPPQVFASEEAKGFIAFLRELGPGIPYLDEILRYEEGNMRALLEGQTQHLRFDCDPRLLLAALAAGEVPDGLAAGSYELELSP